MAQLGRAAVIGYASSFSVTGEGSHLLEAALDRGRDLRHFLVVHVRRGVENYKEGKEQRDEVGVGNQPAFMIDMLFMLLATAHAGLTCFCTPALSSDKKPSSRVSSMRGFMPSRIETTPSTAISRRICSS